MSHCANVVLANQGPSGPPLPRCTNALPAGSMTPQQSAPFLPAILVVPPGGRRIQRVELV
ncbi:hypothetical protein SCLCIDRAFT_30250 [Scleroderma citrinum Foug A]|uniref:Uncharacterized protein n=1 Tax=Scleroderma citrinum Foug A TaxID=1036808 RepID=A0A0C3D422_9AGAM|nr:hypothetical protein SCLCIDRAFT_30250 [Scleroderma citrinum Foug A]